MAKIDLSKFKKPESNYLKPSVSSEKEKINTFKEEKEKPKKSDKIGRPMAEDEPLNVPLTINFTQTEFQKIKDKAGDVPIAKWARGIIRNAGSFN
jgi:hypothetical protein